MPFLLLFIELYVLDYLLHLLYHYYLTILPFPDILYCRIEPNK
jgi:hypothetical protein